MKIDILVKFCILFSVWLRFQWVVNQLGGQNPLRAQSKYGLMGSSAKTVKKNFFEGHRSTFCIKGIGHPPTYTSNAVSMCAVGVQGSQIFKQNSIILFHSKVIVILPIWVSSALEDVGQVVGGYPR